jgi:hypothetical protein
MRQNLSLGVMALTTILLPGAGWAQSQTQTQAETQTQSQSSAQSLANAYRGMLVCEKLPNAADILHVPFDLAVRGDQVQFARPLFNLDGTRVLGSELGAGSVDADGKVHVTSTWDVGGTTIKGDYSGMLTASSGTLSGTQSWRGPEGDARSRTCQVALVPTANAQHSAAR